MWWASPYVAAYLAIIPTVLGIFLIIHELTLHDVIGGVTLSQGGVNFASSLALSKGQLPYNDFVLTQPPGMSILLLPFAWGAHSNGTTALDAARAFTAFISIVDVFLVALTARFHGIAAVFIAGVLFATFPNSFYATSTVTLEPYLLLFSLLAIQVAFTQGHLASGGRLVLAGILVGVAVTIKPWAIVPALVLLVCAAIEWRSALVRVLGGFVIGVVVPCIFFVLAAPGSFFTDVVTGELRGGPGVASAGTPFNDRVAELLGLGPPLGLSSPGTLAIGIGIVIVVLVAVAAIARASASTTLDWALIATVVGLAAIAFVPNHLPQAYSYYLAAFGAIVIGNAVGTLLSLISAISISPGETGASVISGGLTIIIIAAMVAVASVGVPKEADYWRSYFIANGNDPTTAITGAVPKGACVVSTNPEALVLADRFNALPPGCPYVVDPQGIIDVASSTVAASAAWQQLLTEARYVVLAPGQPDLATLPQMNGYFSRNFTIIHTGQYEVLENKSTIVP